LKTGIEHELGRRTALDGLSEKGIDLVPAITVIEKQTEKDAED